jgi:hypothetical protein
MISNFSNLHDLSSMPPTYNTDQVCLPSMKPILNKHFPTYFGPASTFRSLESPHKKPCNNTDKWLEAVVERGLGLSDQTSMPSSSTQNTKNHVQQQEIELPTSPPPQLSAAVSITPPSPAVTKASKGSVEIHSLQNVRELEVLRADGVEVQSLRESVFDLERRLSPPPTLPKLTFLRDADDDSD